MRPRQVWATETNENEPPMKCRNASDVIKIGASSLPRD